MTFVAFFDEIVGRFRCEITAETIYLSITHRIDRYPKTHPKLGGGERDRSRRSLSRSFFDCFDGFGLLHTGVEIARFGDSDLDRDFDLDLGRGDFERLLLLVRDLENV